MDEIMNKVGSYWVGKRANKEIDSLGDDFTSLSSSIEGGTKWLVNKLKGKMQKPLPELLKENDLPVGIFPRDATNYEFDQQTGKLTVFIPSICEVGYRDSSVLRFSTIVSGYLQKGKLVDIQGMKTKVMVWVKVTSVMSDGPKLHFTAGVKRTRNQAVYEVLRDGFAVEKSSEVTKLELVFFAYVDERPLLSLFSAKFFLVPKSFMIIHTELLNRILNLSHDDGNNNTPNMSSSA